MVYITTALKRLWIFFGVVFVVAILSYNASLAACTGSSPTWTSTPDYASIASCVSSAQHGDTINVSAGTSTWTSTLSITKGIKIIASGSVTIQSGASGFLIVYKPDSTTLSAGRQFRLSGFNFALGGRQWIDFINDSNTGAWVLVDNNAVNGMSANPSLRTDGLFYGVIHSNNFTGANSTSMVHFDLYGRDAAADWTYLTLAFGSANNLYFEDNTFTGGDTFFSHGHGGRSVIRYNTFNYTNTSQDIYPWIDIHGNQPSDVYAPLGTEIYGNRLTQSSARSGLMVGHRGGKALIYFNKLVNTSSGFSAYAREEYDDSISKVPSNAIDGQPQHVSNSYYWNNRKGSTGTELITFTLSPVGDGYGCCELTTVGACNTRCTSENGISENREWWNHKTSFDGTSGMGCGTLANRPPTCTTGVGYWATNQSCSDLTGMVGKNPATPISGTLYKCTAPNTWAAYYKPYTYPHPLRTEDLPAPSGPATPTGLKLLAP